jgi:hypothetical protein
MKLLKVLIFVNLIGSQGPARQVPNFILCNKILVAGATDSCEFVANMLTTIYGD